MSKLLIRALVVMAFIYTQAARTEAVDHLAINEPSKFAWKLFVDINQPGDLENRGQKHPEKPLGAEWPVVWETWKLASPEVFPPKGAKPKPWNDWSDHPGGKPEQGVWRTTPGRGRSKAMEALLMQLRGDRNADLLRLLRRRPQFDVTNEAGNETRMNKEAFDFVVDNEFYYLQGQEQAHAEGRPIEFPIAGKEIKARWRKMTDAEVQAHKSALQEGKPPLFHAAQVDDGSYFALIALHITTKDLPNWFWTTFEHKDNPAPEAPTIGDVHFDAYGQLEGPGGILPEEVKNTKWQNYRLRGTQTDFLTSTGQPTILANSVIENGFQKTSSCITCHARATIGAPLEGGRDNRLPVFETVNVYRLRRDLPPDDPEQKVQIQLYGSVGAPDPRLFHDSQGTPLYTQTDFVWSMFRAERRPDEDHEDGPQ